MPDDQIGPVFLAALSLVFGSYGVWELALAYRLDLFGAWIEKAVLGAGGLMLGVLLALCSYRLVEGLSGGIAWTLH
jgi:hypothetical protein